MATLEFDLLFINFYSTSIPGLKQEDLSPLQFGCLCSSFNSFLGGATFLVPHLQHMEVPRLGAELELQLPAYATATATQDPSHVCKLHHSSQQHQIPKPLKTTRNQTSNLMDTSQIHFWCATMGTPHTNVFLGLLPRQQKNKNKPMGPNQTYKILHNIGNHLKKKKKKKKEILLWCSRSKSN